MIPDSSVIVAIDLWEPGHELLVEKLRSADTRRHWHVDLTEAGTVLLVRLALSLRRCWTEVLEVFRRFDKVGILPLSTLVTA